jgi:hypothetical protein
VTRLRFLLAAGAASTVVAAACSLLADGVTAKRWTWAAVGVVCAAAVGAWRGWRER